MPLDKSTGKQCPIITAIQVAFRWVFSIYNITALLADIARYVFLQRHILKFFKT